MLRGICPIPLRSCLFCCSFPEATYPKLSTILKLLASCVPVHRTLFLGELKTDATALVHPAVAELDTLSHSAAVSAAMDASAGAALLRVLLMIGFLMATTRKNGAPKNEAAQAEGVAVIDELAQALEPVWQALSVCVSQLETQLVQTTSPGGLNAAGGVANSVQSLPPTVGKVLPHIEAFLMWCEKLQQAADMKRGVNAFESRASGSQDTTMREAESRPGSPGSRQMDGSESPAHSTGATTPRLWSQQSTPRDSGRVSSFQAFAERHRRLLNAFIRQSPSLLEVRLFPCFSVCMKALFDIRFRFPAKTSWSFF
jgi:hypothetical protein